LKKVQGVSHASKWPIELDSIRYSQAKSRLTKVMHADALLEARVSDKMFSLLFLNPPYDWARTGDDEYVPESERYEGAFLRQYARTLVPGGLLTA